MATNDFFIWEAANIYLGDEDPGASNHLTILDLQLPGMAQTMIDYTPGGAVVAIDFATTMLMKQSITFKLAGMDPDRMTKIGMGSNALQNYTIYGSVRSKRNNKIHQAVAVAHGIIVSITPSGFSRGSGVDLDFAIGSIDRYSFNMDGKSIYKLDFWNNEYIVNGISQTAEQNRALAIPGVV